MNEIIMWCRRAGIRLWVEGDTLRYDAPKGAVTPDLLAEIKANKATVMAELQQPWLSAEDLGDIAEAVITREAQDLKSLFEERAGILEHDAGLPRAEADLEAARTMSTYARNYGYLWASLRLALSGYPSLMALVPDKPGNVDGLPLGVATAHVHKDGRVLKQGEVAGAWEVRI